MEIKLWKMSVYDLAKLGEKFDVVIFMGVLYHQRHPLHALDLIHGHVARDLLVFQSMQPGANGAVQLADGYEFRETEIFEQPDFPKMLFVEKRHANDPTNWWIPNRACSGAMRWSAGFEIATYPEEAVFVCRRKPLPEGPRAIYAEEFAELCAWMTRRCAPTSSPNLQTEKLAVPQPA